MNQDDVRRVLSGNIKRRRKELGITQARLAELADISEPYMNDIERCQTWVSDRTLAKLAWALNMELHELFAGGTEPPPAADGRTDTYRLFQQRKQDMHNYIEETFEALFRDVMAP